MSKQGRSRPALLLPLALGAIGFAAAMPAFAQPGDGKTAAAVDPAAPRYPRTPGQIAADLRWSVEQHGALLIVDPTTNHGPSALRRHRPGQERAGLPPKFDGPLAISAVESYFGYQLVPCGSVKVLAPLTMWVLNHDNLPPPSPYAGVKPRDRFHLLQATLTAAQWDKLCSMGGIGAGDLNGEQRKLWDAMLPARMEVWQSGASNPTVLDAQQRAALRVRVIRTLEYTYRRGDSHVALADDKPRAYVVERWQESAQNDWEPDQRILGQDVLSEVPARAKPGDLPWDWNGLDAQVSLADATTVKDLVARITRATGVELHSELRYADLPVYVRGEQARAGDLLRALCRGVTGTIRKVGPAYVLTDDQIGLGARHRRIVAWIQQNSRLILQAQAEANDKIKAANPPTRLKYEPGDPFAPDDKLRARIAAYRDKMSKTPWPTNPTEATWTDRLLWVPVGDLPPGVRGRVQKRIQADNAATARSERGEAAQVRADVVSPQLQTQTQWIVPGFGAVRANLNGDLSGYLTDTPHAVVPPSPILPASRPLPPQAAIRALLAQVSRPDEAAPLLAPARRAGFTELWVEVLPAASAGETDAAQPTPNLAAHWAELVKAARGHKIALRGVVRPLRTRNKPADPAAIERNVLGEGWAEFVAGLLRTDQAVPLLMAAAPRMPGTEGNFTQHRRMAEQQRLWGDYLALGSPEVLAQAEQAARTLAQVPGLRGIVVRDLTPPGFTGTIAGMDMGWTVPEYDLGYSLARRLALLRQTGVDPIDLSASGGQHLVNSFMPVPGLESDSCQLPFFPDFGTNARGFSMHDERGTRQGIEMGAKDTFSKWDALRAKEADNFATTLRARLIKAAPGTSLLFYQGSVTSGAMYAESRDKFAPSPAQADDGAPPTQPVWPTKAMRQRSSLMLHGVGFLPWFGTPEFGPQQQLNSTVTSLSDPKYKPLTGWDGLVVDLSYQTPAQARELVGGLPPFASQETTKKP